MLADSLAEGVLLSVDEIRVVGRGVKGLSTGGADEMAATDDDESSVGTAAGGSDAVPVEEIREEMDSSRGVDAGGVGVWSTGVVGVLTAAGADVAGMLELDCCWFPAAALLVGAVVSATSEVGVVEVGDGDADAEDVDSAPALLPPPWPPCFPSPSFPFWS